MRRLQFFEEPPKLPIEEGEALSPDPACRRCKLGDGARNACIAPAATVRREGADTVLVVFDSPGQVDDVAGKPGLGNAGKYVRQLVEGAWRGNVVYTHAVACYPGNTKPGASHVKHCRPYLKALDQELRPARILAFGALATRAVSGLGLPPFSTRGAHGHLSDGRLAFYLMNPGATFRNAFVRRWFEEDVARALTSNPAPAPWRGATMLVENAVDAADACDHLAGDWVEGATVSVDVEGFGETGDQDERLLTLGLSTSSDLAFVWDEGVLGELWGHPAMDWPLKLLANSEVSKSAHNAKYDWQKIERCLDTRVRGFSSCTRIHRKLLQADSYASLEDMQTLLGMGGWKLSGQEAAEAAGRSVGLLQELSLLRERGRDAAIRSPKEAKALAKLLDAVAKDEGWRGSQEDLAVAVRRVSSHRALEAYTMAGIDPVVRARYCGMDAASQNGLARAWEPAVRADAGLQRVWEECQRPFHRAVEAMERVGLLIDRQALSTLQEHLATQIASKTAKIAELAGPEFNPASPKELAEKLQSLGARLGRVGASGVPSVNREVLDDVVERANGPRASAEDEAAGELAAGVVDLRRAAKFKSTYADAFEHAIRDDGRVHASIMIDGTESGRPSSNSPNVFNLPRPKSMDGKLCRNLIVAPAGWMLLEVDQSQVEFRMAGVLSGDPVMLAAFQKKDTDFHLATAKLIAPHFGVDPHDVDKNHPLRDKAKTLNFAILYGDTEAGTAFKLGCTNEEARKLRAAILGQFKVLAKWIDQQVKEARRTGQCRVPWMGQPGLIRPLWQIVDADDEARQTAERSSYNTPIQGAAALITNASCGAVQRWIDDGYKHARLVLTVYDSLLLEYRVGYLAEVRAEVRRVCTQWHPLLDVDEKVGSAWGSMRAVEPEDA